MRHHTLNHIHHYKIVQRNEYSKTEEKLNNQQQMDRFV